MVGSVPQREACSTCLAWEPERGRCILVTEDNLTLSLFNTQRRHGGSWNEASDSGGREKARNSKRSIFNRSYRIWGDWGVGEKCVQSLSAWVGFIRGGADLWGDNNKFYSASAEAPSKQWALQFGGQESATVKV